MFVLENNQLAYSTPIERQFAVSPTVRAAGYGIAAVTVDGNDVEAVFAAVRAARERALTGGGPTLIEAQTMRMHGHGAHDDMRYVAPELLAAWVERDPIERQERRGAALGVDVAALRGEIDAIVEEAVAAALASPLPDPASVLAGVFLRGRARAARQWARALERLRCRCGGRCVMAVRTYLQAISEGLREAMRADERVFVMGEDVAAFGGAFKVTDGLVEEFGEQRVIDPPLAEAGIVGTAVGAAIAGLRPVCEMQFADFEHKHLYRRVKEELPDGTYETPMTARVAREGTDLTVIAYGAMVHTALKATTNLDDASVELLDLRSLVPLAALIAEHAFEHLDAPIHRLATPDIPIPFSPPLEHAVLPNIERIRDACRDLLTY